MTGSSSMSNGRGKIVNTYGQTTATMLPAARAIGLERAGRNRTASSTCPNAQSLAKVKEPVSQVVKPPQDLETAS